jgi:FtsP/CotA-like multicopper oxidase with cupredoxin domain
MNKFTLLIATAVILLTASAAATQIQNARAATTRSFTLYGTFNGGWGFNSSVSSPGPTITVEQGDTVNLTLISADGITHRFFLSYTNSTSPTSSDNESQDFSGTTNFQFVAGTVVGTYEYRCAHHPDVMWGYFEIVPTGTLVPEFEPLMILSTLIAVSTVFAVSLRIKRKV